MKHTIVTMSDSRYFEYGKHFLETRHIMKDAECVLFGPDITDRQHTELTAYDIKYVQIDKHWWDTQMQMLKFWFCMTHLPAQNITFCDFDTFFCKDFSHVYDKTFDIGITIRKPFVERGRPMRAFANGGVFYIQNQGILFDALDCIQNFGSDKIPEYDEIWKTLEENRKPEKTHNRTNFRWWVDQIFLSALVKRKIDRRRYQNYKIELFDCEQYNHVDADYNDDKDYYMGHMKRKGAPANLKD